MDEIIQTIQNALNNALGAPLTVILLAMIPITEARLSIPIGMGMGLSPFESFGYALLGSSLIAPILLLVFMPIINALSRTKVFSKLGKFLYDKFEKKSRSLKDDDPPPETDGNEQKKRRIKITKHDAKKMGGTALFVAVPLPLTGIWSGSAVASIIKLGFVKGLISLVGGNIVACTIITLVTMLFPENKRWIVTLAFSIIAVIVVIVLIIKFILYKPDKHDEKAEVSADAAMRDPDGGNDDNDKE